MQKIKKLLSIFIIFSQITAVFSYSYEELKNSMMQNNPELLGMQEEYTRSLLDVKDAYWSLGPTVDLQLSGTYMLNPPVDAIYVNVGDVVNSLNWPTSVKPTVGNQYLKIYDGMENTLYNAQLSLQQPIFTWGKIANSIKLYKELSNVKQTHLSSTQKQKESELETRLITLIHLEKMLEILGEEEKFVNKMVAFSENAEKAGMMIHQDVVDAKIQAKQLEISKLDINEQINQQYLELQKLTGLEDISKENIEYEYDEKKILEVLNLNREECIQDALSGNQDTIKMLTQTENINKLAEKIAKGYVNWKPDVALQISGGYGGSRFPFVEPNWFRKDDYSLNISVGIKTTIWDGGKKLRDVSRKISETKTASIKQADARSTIKQTLNSQWNTADVCTLKIDYQDLKIESMGGKIKQKENEYNNGYATQADVLTVKIDLCNQKIEKIRQSLSRDVACMTIKYLIGK